MEKHESDNESAPLRLEELSARCLGNIEFVQRVLDRFQESFTSDLELLEGLLPCGDADQIAHLAHRMKGASANAGAPVLRAQTAGIEELARTDRMDEIPVRLGQLRDEWSRFVNSMASLELGTDAAV